MIPDEIRKQSRSVKNRIRSIVSDAEFVQCVQEAYEKPLVANKRCGLWYIPPKFRQETCYFKSTDGHTGEWAFSIKRLNLHLIPFICENQGAILVDSTRRGKAMPDAFSKTVPIWCSVINRAIFGHSELHLPPRVVSQSEKQQISDRIDEWAANLLAMVPKSQFTVDRPLRPIWVTQDGLLPPVVPEFSDFYPVILCTASERAQDGQIHRQGYSYVQGAADDHELWAGQLTPEMLWTHDELRQDISET